MDGGKIGKPKIFSTDPDDVWAEALLPAQKGLGEADPVSFPLSAIARVRALGPSATHIRLTDGLEINLRLPYHELLEKIKNPGGEGLDLKPYAVLEEKEAFFGKLREEFSRRAEDEKYAPIENLSFTALVRAPNNTEFRHFSFTGRDVFAREIATGGSILGGNNIRFKLRSGDDSPFGTQEFIIEGEFDVFRALCREAYDKGETKLDLTGFSPKAPPEPAAPENKQQASTQQANKPQGRQP